ncbi:MAG: alpha/beta hydrolase [Clostridia bacterium]|nr:alpha/beta hydrolase [Clostridia bacterium]
MKIIAWILLGFVVLIILALAYYLVVGAILFRFAFSRRSVTAKALKKNFDQKLKDNKIDLCWWNAQKFEKVRTTSHDGLKLIGHLKEANSNKTVIVVHGFGGNYQEMQQYCKFFVQKNFNVLTIDNRTHGESEGKCIGFGWLDSKDILQWIKFVNDKTPDNQILLFGLSMGGAAVCMTAGETELKNVAAIVSDCAYANADRQIEHVMRKHKFFFKLVKKHLYSYAKRIHNFDVYAADAAKQVKNTKVPILYIHGQEDEFVPLENLKVLYEATPAEMREKYVVEGASHAMAYPVAGVLYEKKVCDFLRKRTLIG